MQEMQETQIWCLVPEDPLEEEMATHSSILAGIILWAEEPGRLYSSWGHKELDTTERLRTYTEMFRLNNFILTFSPEHVQCDGG